MESSELVASVFSMISVDSFIATSIAGIYTKNIALRTLFSCVKEILNTSISLV